MEQVKGTEARWSIVEISRNKCDSMNCLAARRECLFMFCFLRKGLTRSGAAGDGGLAVHTCWAGGRQPTCWEGPLGSSRRLSFACFCM